VQALLKLRPVAGNLELGNAATESLRRFLFRRHDPAAVTGSIREMRTKIHRGHARRFTAGPSGIDVKTGEGGIRDIEFLVQGLQLHHCGDHPSAMGGNTLEAIEGLSRAGVIDEPHARQLRDDYVLLRRVEHYLQLLEDRQTHTLPTGEDELDTLARRVHGPRMAAAAFRNEMDQVRGRVADAMEQFLRGVE
jgi:glutamate-ammonia-ligase adenylyltransferase